MGSLSGWKTNLLPGFLQIASGLFLQDIPVLFCSYFTLYPHKLSRACSREASPYYDAASTMLHAGEGMFMVTYQFDAVKLTLGHIRPEELLPAAVRVSLSSEDFM